MRRIALLIFLIVILAGCRQQRRYQMRGTILAIDSAQQRITIKHEDIPGLMPAMTMIYPLENKNVLRQLKVGEQIQAELVIEDNRGRSEKISPVAP